MAGRGPAPKDPARRLGHSKDPHPQTNLAADGRVRGPRLPGDLLPESEGWHPATLAWWDTWRRSPQAQQFTATDWSFLLDTALMHHVMWARGRWEFAAEVRLRAAKMGATPEDRMRLRMTVETPATAKPPRPSAKVTSLEDRRRRLLTDDAP